MDNSSKKQFEKSGKINWTAIIILSVLIVFACFLRFRMLDVKLFWFDEFLTEERAFFSWPKIWATYFTRRVLVFSVMMKLYALLITAINHAEYFTEYQLRVPCAILGVLDVVAVFLIAKRVKDNLAGLVAAALATFSSFLIYYSREARYYPLLFLVSAVLIGLGLLFLQQGTPKQKTKYCVLYSLVAVIGMYVHSGFWMLFAISNVFLVASDFLTLFSPKNSGKFFTKIACFVGRVFVFALPLLFSLPLFLQLFSSKSSRGVDDGKKLLEHFSYTFLNNYSLRYWELFPLVKFVLPVIFLMVVWLLIFSCQRKLIVYLLSIKLMPFVIALFLPSNIIKEGLRPNYLIYVYISDLLIFAFFVSDVANKVRKLTVRFLSPRIEKILYQSLIVVIIALIGGLSLGDLLRSKHYKSQNHLYPIAQNFFNICRAGDFIITDELELSMYMRHLKNAGKIKEIFGGSIVDFSKDYSLPGVPLKRLVFITRDETQQYPGVNDLGKAGACYFATLALKTTPSSQFIRGITALVIERSSVYTYSGMNKSLENWRSNYVSASVKKYLEKPSEFINLIQNGDFEEGFNNWTLGKEKDFVKPISNSTNSYLSINSLDAAKKSWYYVRQTVEVVSNQTYVISAEVRCNKEKCTSDSKAFLAISKNIKKGQDKNFCYLDLLNKSDDTWKRKALPLKFDTSGKVVIRLQFTAGLEMDIKNIVFHAE